MRWAVLAIAAALGGCAQTDPYQQPAMWQPTGANTLNLAAMVANPRDLIRGHGVQGSGGAEAVPPITRLFTGHPAPLPSSSSQASASGPAAQAPAGQGAN